MRFLCLVNRSSLGSCRRDDDVCVLRRVVSSEGGGEGREYGEHFVRPRTVRERPGAARDEVTGRDYGVVRGMRSRFRAPGVRHQGGLAPEAPGSEDVALRAKYEEIRHANCYEKKLAKGGRIPRGRATKVFVVYAQVEV